MYQIRLLTPHDLPALMDLHKRIIRHIGGKKDLLIVERERSYFDEVIAYHGFVVGAFFGSTLIGYSSLRRPQEGEENFGIYARLPPAEFPFLAHANGSMVCPLHRGHGLHQQMARARTAEALRRGIYHQLSEVHGSNPPSLKNLFSMGFQVHGLKIEDDDEFLIFLHSQNQGSEFADSSEFSAMDYRGQRKALALGSIGYALREYGDRCLIRYGVPIAPTAQDILAQENSTRK